MSPRQDSNPALAPSRRQIVNAQTVSQDLSSSPVFEIPNDAEELSLLIQATQAKGKGGALVTGLQSTPDGGRSWAFTGNSVVHKGTGMQRVSFARRRNVGQEAKSGPADIPELDAEATACNGMVSRKARLIFRTGANAEWMVNAWLETE